MEGRMRGIARVTLGAVALFGICIGVQAARAQETRSSAVKFEYTIDTTDAPELKDWAEKLRPEIDIWYPRIVQYLPSDGYSAPKKFTITFKKMDGVAYTAGT